MFINTGMNIVGFISGLFWRPSGKPKKTPRRTETTQEAAARALQSMRNKRR